MKLLGLIIICLCIIMLVMAAFYSKNYFLNQNGINLLVENAGGNGDPTPLPPTPPPEPPPPPGMIQGSGILLG